MILVTGGAGFIGSHLVERLLRQERSVVVLDNFNDLYAPALKEKNIAGILDHPEAVLVRGDILDRPLLDSIFAKYGIEQIIHLAALAGVRASLLSPWDYVRVDIEGTVNLLEKAKEEGIQQFVFGSSSSVYGCCDPHPFRESDGATEPVSPYATAKRGAELYCRTYHELYGVPTVILRFFTVYGPRQRPDMAIHRFTRLIEEGQPVPMYGDGTSARDYTYVDDIVDGIMAVTATSFSWEIFNLGNNLTTKLRELISLLGKMIGREPKIEQQADQPGDVPFTCADISLAQSKLAYQPKIQLEEGLRRFIRWFRERHQGRATP